MNCCALTTILYLDKACMGESTIPMTFHSRLKENNINNQANFIIKDDAIISRHNDTKHLE